MQKTEKTKSSEEKREMQICIWPKTILSNQSPNTNKIFIIIIIIIISIQIIDELIKDSFSSVLEFINNSTK